MSTNIEIEVKTLITKKDYEKVLEYFKDIKKEEIDQTNYYIDTKDSELRRHEISLRIRKLNGFVMTLKTPLSEGLLEKSQLISEHEFNEFINKNIFPHGPISEFIERLYIDPTLLVPQAELNTIRISIPYEGCLLAIDKNTYAGKTDFELEMEGSSLDKARVLLEELCEKIGVKFAENRVSKQRRALIAHNKLKA